MSITDQVAALLDADRREHELDDARDPRAPRRKLQQLWIKTIGTPGFDGFPDLEPSRNSTLSELHRETREIAHLLAAGCQMQTGVYRVNQCNVWAMVQAVVIRGETVPTTRFYVNGKRRGLGEVRRIVEGRVQ